MAAEGVRPRYSSETLVDLLSQTGKLANLEILYKAGMLVRLGSRQMHQRTIIGVPMDIDGTEHPSWLIAAPRQTNVLVSGPSGTAGKSESMIDPNILNSRGPVIVTSTKPDSIERVGKIVQESGRPVYIFDPSGSLKKTNPELLTSLGIETSTWSPLDGDGSYDWALKQSDILMGASTLEKDKDDNKYYWESWARMFLAPILLACANATGADLRANEVRTRIQLLLQKAEVNGDNIQFGVSMLTSIANSFQGRINALESYTDALKEDPKAIPLEIVDQLLTKARNKKREEATTIFEPGAQEPEVMDKGAQIRKEVEQRKLDGEIAQLEEMRIANPLTINEAQELNDELFNEKFLLLRHVKKLEKAYTQIEGEDQKTANTYNQMVQMVLEPWATVGSLTSARTESALNVFDPEEFLRTDGVLFVYIPLEDMKSLSPLGTTLISKTLNTAMRIRGSSPEKRLTYLPKILLDEQITAAPIRDFPSIMTAVRGAAELVTVVQSLSALGREYDENGRSMISTNHQCKLFMTTNADQQELAIISQLLGSTENSDVTFSTSTGVGFSGGTTSNTEGTIYLPLADIASLFGLKKNVGIFMAEGQKTLVALKRIEDIGLGYLVNDQEKPDIVNKLTLYETVEGESTISLVRIISNIIELRRHERQLATRKPTEIPDKTINFLVEHKIDKEEAAAVLINTLEKLGQIGVDLARQLQLDPQTIPELLEYIVPDYRETFPRTDRRASVREARRAREILAQLDEERAKWPTNSRSASHV